MPLRTGKLPASYDSRTLQFKDFLTPGVAQYPQAQVGFGEAHARLVPVWEMLGNGPDDSVEPGFGGAGDCVIADAGHRVIYSNALAGKTVKVTGKECIEVYSALTGYVIGVDSTDRGTDMRNAMNYCRNTGMLAADGSRHKIGGYCALEAGNFGELLQALAVFDVVSIGVEFPQSAMDQFNAGRVWSYVRSSPIEGGHDIMVVGRPTTYDGDCVTWGRKQRFTKSFYSHLNDEAYGIFLPESMVAGKSPEGFNMTDFQAALAAL